MKRKALYYLVISIAASVFFLIKNCDSFKPNFNPTALSQKYSNSQYIKGEKGVVLSDYELDAYVGWHLIRGGDPSEAGFAHPPLGRYLIGVSEIVFKNPNTINVFYLSLILFVTALVANQITQKFSAGVLAIFILLLSAIFVNQFQFAGLDLPLTLFLLSSFYFLIAKRGRRRFWVAAVFIGLSAATKYWMLTTYLTFVILGYFLIFEQKSFFKFLYSLFISGFIFLFSYLGYFLSGHGLIEFVNYLKFIFKWWQGNPLQPGGFFKMIFLGKIIPWWKTEIRSIEVESWSLMVPLVFIFGTLGGLFSLVESISLKKKKLALFSTIFFSYLLYLFLIPPATRYLVLLFPFLAVFSSCLLVNFTKRLG